jgi:hypothetical protein
MLVIYLAIAAGTLLAAVFVASAFSKVRGRRQFALFVTSTVELGLPASIPPRLGAAAIVSLEAAVPVLLVLLPPAGFCLAVALLGVFLVAIVRAHRAGSRVACRCFGDSGSPLGPRHAVRNSALIVMALLGAATANAAAPSQLAIVIAAVGAGLIGSVVFILFDDISDLFVMRSS